MKTLLFVAPHIGYGGAEKNFIGIANYAVEKGYRVYLLTEEGRENVRTIDLRIVQYKTKIDAAGNLLKKYYQAVTAIRKAIKTSNADVVISFVELWRSASVIATRFTETKCIVSERVDPYTRSGRFNKIVFKIFSMADGYVFQTQQARDFFARKVREKGIIIPNPVFKDDALSKYEGEKKDIIVSIARLDIKQKRQDILIKAFNEIKDICPNLKLYLYGSGKDENAIKELIANLHLEERVLLKGITRDVYHSLGEAKLMVLSSDYEGIPNAIIESMCLGVPVVSTKCSPGGAELLITDHYNGLLVERGDISGLARAIRECLEDKELSDRLVENAFDIKDKFNENRLLPEWLNYIEEICCQ